MPKNLINALTAEMDVRRRAIGGHERQFAALEAVLRTLTNARGSRKPGNKMARGGNRRLKQAKKMNRAKSKKKDKKMS
jgi:hypothetical protein